MARKKKEEAEFQYWEYVAVKEYLLNALEHAEDAVEDSGLESNLRDFAAMVVEGLPRFVETYRNSLLDTLNHYQTDGILYRPDGYETLTQTELKGIRDSVADAYYRCEEWERERRKLSKRWADTDDADERREIDEEYALYEKTTEEVQLREGYRALDAYIRFRETPDHIRKQMASMSDLALIRAVEDQLWQLPSVYDEMVSPQLEYCAINRMAVTAKAIRTRYPKRQAALMSPFVQEATNPNSKRYNAIHRGDAYVHPQYPKISLLLLPSDELPTLILDDLELLDAIYSIYIGNDNSPYIPITLIAKVMKNSPDPQTRITKKERDEIVKQINRLRTRLIELRFSDYIDRQGRRITRTISDNIIRGILYEETINGVPNVQTLFLDGMQVLFYYTAEVLGQVATYDSDLREIPGLKAHSKTRRLIYYLLRRVLIETRNAKRRIEDKQANVEKSGNAYRAPKSKRVIFTLKSLYDQSGLYDGLNSERAKRKAEQELRKKMLPAILTHWKQKKFIASYKVNEAEEAVEIRLNLQ